MSTPIIMNANAYNSTNKTVTVGGVTYYVIGTIDKTVASACTPCQGTWTVQTDGCEGSQCADLTRTIKCVGPGNCPADPSRLYPLGVPGETKTVFCGTVANCARAVLASTFTGCFDGTTSVNCGGNKYRQYTLNPMSG
jgi:hypothetical protein